MNGKVVRHERAKGVRKEKGQESGEKDEKRLKFPLLQVVLPFRKVAWE